MAVANKEGGAMSFDIFLVCMRNGEPATFKRTLAEEVMNRGAIDPDLPLLNITYADGGGGVAYIDEDEDIDSVSFDHFGGDTFYNRLWDLMDRTGSFLFWPAVGRKLAVTRPEIVSHIDEDTVEDLGPAFIVRSGKELEDAIEFGIDPNEPENDEE